MAKTNILIVFVLFFNAYVYSQFTQRICDSYYENHDQALCQRGQTPDPPSAEYVRMRNTNGGGDNYFCVGSDGQSYDAYMESMQYSGKIVELFFQHQCGGFSCQNPGDNSKWGCLDSLGMYLKYQNVSYQEEEFPVTLDGRVLANSVTGQGSEFWNLSGANANSSSFSLVPTSPISLSFGHQFTLTVHSTNNFCTCGYIWAKVVQDTFAYNRSTDAQTACSTGGDCIITADVQKRMTEGWWPVGPYKQHPITPICASDMNDLKGKIWTPNPEPYQEILIEHVCGSFICNSSLGGSKFGCEDTLTQGLIGVYLMRNGNEWIPEYNMDKGGVSDPGFSQQHLYYRHNIYGPNSPFVKLEPTNKMKGNTELDLWFGEDFWNLETDNGGGCSCFYVYTKQSPGACTNDNECENNGRCKASASHTDGWCECDNGFGGVRCVENKNCAGQSTFQQSTCPYFGINNPLDYVATGVAVSKYNGYQVKDIGNFFLSFLPTGGINFGLPPVSTHGSTGTITCEQVNPFLWRVDIQLSSGTRMIQGWLATGGQELETWQSIFGFGDTSGSDFVLSFKDECLQRTSSFSEAESYIYYLQRKESPKLQSTYSELTNRLFFLEYETDSMIESKKFGSIRFGENWFNLRKDGVDSWGQVFYSPEGIFNSFSFELNFYPGELSPHSEYVHLTQTFLCSPFDGRSFSCKTNRLGTATGASETYMFREVHQQGECPNDICFNGGSCFWSHMLMCSCPAGFSGDFCEYKLPKYPCEDPLVFDSYDVTQCYEVFGEGKTYNGTNWIGQDSIFFSVNHVGFGYQGLMITGTSETFFDLKCRKSNYDIHSWSLSYSIQMKEIGTNNVFYGNVNPMGTSGETFVLLTTGPDSPDRCQYPKTNSWWSVPGVIGGQLNQLCNENLNPTAGAICSNLARDLPGKFWSGSFLVNGTIGNVSIYFNVKGSDSFGKAYVKTSPSINGWDGEVFYYQCPSDSTSFLQFGNSANTYFKMDFGLLSPKNSYPTYLTKALVHSDSVSLIIRADYPSSCCAGSDIGEIDRINCSSRVVMELQPATVDDPVCVNGNLVFENNMPKCVCEENYFGMFCEKGGFIDKCGHISTSECDPEIFSGLTNFRLFEGQRAETTYWNVTFSNNDYFKARTNLFFETEDIVVVCNPRSYQEWDQGWQKTWLLTAESPRGQFKLTFQLQFDVTRGETNSVMIVNSISDDCTIPSFVWNNQLDILDYVIPSWGQLYSMSPVCPDPFLPDPCSTVSNMASGIWTGVITDLTGNNPGPPDNIFWTVNDDLVTGSIFVNGSGNDGPMYFPVSHTSCGDVIEGGYQLDLVLDGFNTLRGLVGNDGPDIQMLVSPFGGCTYPTSFLFPSIENGTESTITFKKASSCLDKPCVYGTCQDVADSFVCICDDFVAGDACDETLVSPDPCEKQLQEFYSGTVNGCPSLMLENATLYASAVTDFENPFDAQVTDIVKIQFGQKKSSSVGDIYNVNLMWELGGEGLPTGPMIFECRETYFSDPQQGENRYVAYTRLLRTEGIYKGISSFATIYVDMRDGQTQVHPQIGEGMMMFSNATVGLCDLPHMGSNGPSPNSVLMTVASVCNDPAGSATEACNTMTSASTRYPGVWVGVSNKYQGQVARIPQKIVLIIDPSFSLGEHHRESDSDGMILPVTFKCGSEIQDTFDFDMGLSGFLYGRIVRGLFNYTGGEIHIDIGNPGGCERGLASNDSESWVLKKSVDCSINPCLHGGNCIIGGGSFGYSCECGDGYSGLYCQNVETSPKNCSSSNYGRCKDYFDSIFGRRFVGEMRMNGDVRSKLDLPFFGISFDDWELESRLSGKASFGPDYGLDSKFFVDCMWSEGSEHFVDFFWVSGPKKGNVTSARMVYNAKNCTDPLSPSHYLEIDLLINDNTCQSSSAMFQMGMYKRFSFDEQCTPSTFDTSCVASNVILPGFYVMNIKQCADMCNCSVIEGGMVAGFSVLPDGDVIITAPDFKRKGKLSCGTKDEGTNTTPIDISIPVLTKPSEFSMKGSHFKNSTHEFIVLSQDGSCDYPMFSPGDISLPNEKGRITLELSKMNLTPDQGGQCTQNPCQEIGGMGTCWPSGEPGYGNLCDETNYGFCCACNQTVPKGYFDDVCFKAGINDQVSTCLANVSDNACPSVLLGNSFSLFMGFEDLKPKFVTVYEEQSFLDVLAGVVKFEDQSINDLAPGTVYGTFYASEKAANFLGLRGNFEYAYDANLHQGNRVGYKNTYPMNFRMICSIDGMDQEGNNYYSIQMNFEDIGQTRIGKLGGLKMNENAGVTPNDNPYGFFLQLNADNDIHDCSPNKPASFGSLDGTCKNTQIHSSNCQDALKALDAGIQPQDVYLGKTLRNECLYNETSGMCDPVPKESHMSFLFNWDAGEGIVFSGGSEYHFGMTCNAGMDVSGTAAVQIDLNVFGTDSFVVHGVAGHIGNNRLRLIINSPGRCRDLTETDIINTEVWKENDYDTEIWTMEPFTDCSQLSSVDGVFCQSGGMCVFDEKYPYCQCPSFTKSAYQSPYQFVDGFESYFTAHENPVCSQIDPEKIIDFPQVNPDFRDMLLKGNVFKSEFEFSHSQDMIHKYIIMDKFDEDAYPTGKLYEDGEAISSFILLSSNETSVNIAALNNENKLVSHQCWVYSAQLNPRNNQLEIETDCFDFDFWACSGIECQGDPSTMRWDQHCNSDPPLSVTCTDIVGIGADLNGKWKGYTYSKSEEEGEFYQDLWVEFTGGVMNVEAQFYNPYNQQTEEFKANLTVKCDAEGTDVNGYTWYKMQGVRNMESMNFLIAVYDGGTRVVLAVSQDGVCGYPIPGDPFRALPDLDSNTNSFAYIKKVDSGCSGSPCDNGGTCVNVPKEIDKYRFGCDCVADYQGLLCQRPAIDPCNYTSFGYPSALPSYFNGTLFKSGTDNEQDVISFGSNGKGSWENSLKGVREFTYSSFDVGTNKYFVILFVTSGVDTNKYFSMIVQTADAQNSDWFVFESFFYFRAHPNFCDPANLSPYPEDPHVYHRRWEVLCNSEVDPTTCNPDFAGMWVGTSNFSMGPSFAAIFIDSNGFGYYFVEGDYVEYDAVCERNCFMLDGNASTDCTYPALDRYVHSSLRLRVLDSLTQPVAMGLVGDTSHLKIVGGDQCDGYFTGDLGAELQALNLEKFQSCSIGVDPCGGRGLCKDTQASMEGFVCECSPGYEGKFCQNKRQECPNPVNTLCSNEFIEKEFVGTWFQQENSVFLDSRLHFTSRAGSGEVLVNFSLPPPVGSGQGFMTCAGIFGTPDAYLVDIYSSAFGTSVMRGTLLFSTDQDGKKVLIFWINWPGNCDFGNATHHDMVFVFSQNYPIPPPLTVGSSIFDASFGSNFNGIYSGVNIMEDNGMQRHETFELVIEDDANWVSKFTYVLLHSETPTLHNVYSGIFTPDSEPFNSGVADIEGIKAVLTIQTPAIYKGINVFVEIKKNNPFSDKPGLVFALSDLPSPGVFPDIDQIDELNVPLLSLLISDKIINQFWITQTGPHYDGVCFDGIQNGDESGVDCGGSYCRPCCMDRIYTQNAFDSEWDRQRTYLHYTMNQNYWWGPDNGQLCFWKMDSGIKPILTYDSPFQTFGKKLEASFEFFPSFGNWEMSILFSETTQPEGPNDIVVRFSRLAVGQSELWIVKGGAIFQESFINLTTLFDSPDYPSSVQIILEDTFVIVNYNGQTYQRELLDPTRPMKYFSLSGEQTDLYQQFCFDNLMLVGRECADCQPLASSCPMTLDGFSWWGTPVTFDGNGGKSGTEFGLRFTFNQRNYQSESLEAEFMYIYGDGKLGNFTHPKTAKVTCREISPDFYSIDFSLGLLQLRGSFLGPYKEYGSDSDLLDLFLNEDGTCARGRPDKHNFLSLPEGTERFYVKKMCVDRNPGYFTQVNPKLLGTLKGYSSEGNYGVGSRFDLNITEESGITKFVYSQFDQESGEVREFRGQIFSQNNTVNCAKHQLLLEFPLNYHGALLEAHIELDYIQTVPGLHYVALSDIGTCENLGISCGSKSWGRGLQARQTWVMSKDEYPLNHDGIQNDDEKGVDCGGKATPTCYNIEQFFQDHFERADLGANYTTSNPPAAFISNGQLCGDNHNNAIVAQSFDAVNIDVEFDFWGVAFHEVFAVSSSLEKSNETAVCGVTWADNGGYLFIGFIDMSQPGNGDGPNFVRERRGDYVPLLNGNESIYHLKCTFESYKFVRLEITTANQETYVLIENSQILFNVYGVTIGAQQKVCIDDLTISGKRPPLEDPCSVDPCNGHTCENLANGIFKCTCQQGYCGDTCNVPPCKAGLERSVSSGTNCTCSECPVGTANIAAGGTCEPCKEGHFSNAPGASICQQCGQGTFQDVTGQQTCKPCSEGTYNVNFGQSSCPRCPLGTISTTEGSINCDPCQPGTGTKPYTDANGNFLFNTTDCSPCAPGSYSPGMICQPCEPGYYSSVEGTIECTSCPKDHYSTSGRTQCIKCPIGTYAPTMPRSQCILCPDNYFYNYTTSTCENCPQDRISVSGSNLGAGSCKLDVSTPPSPDVVVVGLKSNSFTANIATPQGLGNGIFVRFDLKLCLLLNNLQVQCTTHFTLGNSFVFSSLSSNTEYSLIVRLITRDEDNKNYFSSTSVKATTLKKPPKIITFAARGTTDAPLIDVVFSNATNQMGSLDKAGVDALFSFVNGAGSFGTDYTGQWNPAQDGLRITIVDSAGMSLFTGLTRIQVRSNANVKEKDPTSNSDISVSISNPLTGEFSSVGNSPGLIKKFLNYMKDESFDESFIPLSNLLAVENVTSAMTLDIILDAKQQVDGNDWAGYVSVGSDSSSYGLSLQLDFDTDIGADTALQGQYLKLKAHFNGFIQFTAQLSGQPIVGAFVHILPKNTLGYITAVKNITVPMGSSIFTTIPQDTLAIGDYDIDNMANGSFRDYFQIYCSNMYMAPHSPIEGLEYEITSNGILSVYGTLDGLRELFGYMQVKGEEKNVIVKFIDNSNGDPDFDPANFLALSTRGTTYTVVSFKVIPQCAYSTPELSSVTLSNDYFQVKIEFNDILPGYDSEVELIPYFLFDGHTQILFGVGATVRAGNKDGRFEIVVSLTQGNTINPTVEQNVTIIAGAFKICGQDIPELVMPLSPPFQGDNPVIILEEQAKIDLSCGTSFYLKSRCISGCGFGSVISTSTIFTWTLPSEYDHLDKTTTRGVRLIPFDYFQPDKVYKFSVFVTNAWGKTSVADEITSITTSLPTITMTTTIPSILHIPSADPNSPKYLKLKADVVFPSITCAIPLHTEHIWAHSDSFQYDNQKSDISIPIPTSAATFTISYDVESTFPQLVVKSNSLKWKINVYKKLSANVVIAPGTTVQYIADETQPLSKMVFAGLHSSIFELPPAMDLNIQLTYSILDRYLYPVLNAVTGEELVAERDLSDPLAYSHIWGRIEELPDQSTGDEFLIKYLPGPGEYNLQLLVKDTLSGSSVTSTTNFLVVSVPQTPLYLVHGYDKYIPPNVNLHFMANPANPNTTEHSYQWSISGLNVPPSVSTTQPHFQYNPFLQTKKPLIQGSSLTISVTSTMLIPYREPTTLSKTLLVNRLPPVGSVSTDCDGLEAFKSECILSVSATVDPEGHNVLYRPYVKYNSLKKQLLKSYFSTDTTFLVKRMPPGTHLFGFEVTDDFNQNYPNTPIFFGFGEVNATFSNVTAFADTSAIKDFVSDSIKLDESQGDKEATLGLVQTIVDSFSDVITEDPDFRNFVVASYKQAVNETSLIVQNQEAVLDTINSVTNAMEITTDLFKDMFNGLVVLTTEGNPSATSSSYDFIQSLALNIGKFLEARSLGLLSVPEEHRNTHRSYFSLMADVNQTELDDVNLMYSTLRNLVKPSFIKPLLTISGSSYSTDTTNLATNSERNYATSSFSYTHSFGLFQLLSVPNLPNPSTKELVTNVVFEKPNSYGSLTNYEDGNVRSPAAMVNAYLLSNDTNMEISFNVTLNTTCTVSTCVPKCLAWDVSKSEWSDMRDQQLIVKTETVTETVYGTFVSCVAGPTSEQIIISVFQDFSSGGKKDEGIDVVPIAAAGGVIVVAIILFYCCCKKKKGEEKEGIELKEGEGMQGSTSAKALTTTENETETGVYEARVV